MPELAEVEYFRKRWNPGLGDLISRVECHPKARIFRGSNLKELSAALTGARLLDSEAHGKQMLFRFDRATLGIHLGMTGELRSEDPKFVAGKHDHLVLRQKSQALVFSDPRLFGRILFQPGAADPEWWTERAPAVLSREFSKEALANFLQRRRRTSIKAILLMQEHFPGVGNWMADEILWQSRIHPATAGGNLADVEELWKITRTVCRKALKIIGTDWSDPPTIWLFSHRWKEGGYCPRCGLELARGVFGGRTTCWCAHCQKG